MPLPRRLYLIILTKNVHQLWNKNSNISTHGSHSYSNYHHRPTYRFLARVASGSMLVNQTAKSTNLRFSEMDLQAQRLREGENHLMSVKKGLHIMKNVCLDTCCWRGYLSGYVVAIHGTELPLILKYFSYITDNGHQIKTEQTLNTSIKTYFIPFLSIRVPWSCPFSFPDSWFLAGFWQWKRNL